VLRVTGDREAYFWNTQGKGELDLLLFLEGKRYGLEFKYSDAPTVTRSMSIAHDDLRLERLLVVHPGEKSYPLDSWAEALAIADVRPRLRELAGKTSRRERKSRSTV
jgi:hypothetical protein